MGNGTHENLLHENFLTRMINKVCNEVSFIHAHVANTRILHFNFKGRMDLKGLLSTSIASVTTAAERLLEMGAIQI